MNRLTQRTLYKFARKEFKLITLFNEDFFVGFKAKTAHLTFKDFLGLLLLTLYANNFHLGNLLAASLYSSKYVSNHLTLSYLSTGNNSILQRTEDTLNSELSNLRFDNFGGKQCLH